MCLSIFRLQYCHRCINNVTLSRSNVDVSGFHQIFTRDTLIKLKFILKNCTTSLFSLFATVRDYTLMVSYTLVLAIPNRTERQCSLQNHKVRLLRFYSVKQNPSFTKSSAQNKKLIFICLKKVKNVQDFFRRS